MRPPGWRGSSPRPSAAAHTELRGSASRERNHGVGDHPIPFRTRQLSPTSPKVLRRQAAGGQVVPLAGGAFPFARASPGPRLRHRRRPAGCPFVFRGGLSLRGNASFFPGWHRRSDGHLQVLQANLFCEIISTIMNDTHSGVFFCFEGPVPRGPCRPRPPLRRPGLRPLRAVAGGAASWGGLVGRKAFSSGRTERASCGLWRAL